MPRVKFDYIVSFSSEDPENQATNLLASNVSKKKWLCNKGEPSCSVVLQLTKAVQISSVHIGAHNSALVEVLVGRSEKPNDPYQVLVPSSVFQSPAEARRAGSAAGSAAERVRSFDGEALGAAAAERWDRVRIVCSQPYNKHVKYGLSFVHIHSPEAAPAPALATTPASAPARSPAPAPASYSSDEETEFRPGELFAAHLQRAKTPTNTYAQIRQATSLALKNIPDSSIKLVKTSIVKGDTPSPAARAAFGAHGRAADDKGRPKADERYASKHGDRLKDDRSKIDDRNTFKKDDRSRTDDRNTFKTDVRLKTGDDRQGGDERKAPRARRAAGRGGQTSSTNGSDNGSAAGLSAGPVSSAPHTLLRGVVFQLSGYQNPERARIRAAATALGAALEAPGGPPLTHLLCAFPNTPRLRAARGAVVAARGEWVLQMARRRRLLPWQWYATEPRHRVAPPEHISTEEDDDTDDEIERVRRKMKKPRSDPAPSDSPPRGASPRAPVGASDGSDVEFVQDERMQGIVSLSESEGGSTDADPEPLDPADEEVDPAATLPDFFEGRSFAVRGPPDRARRLARYLRAYGGLVLQDPSEHADYVVDDTSRVPSPGGARHVTAGWVWRCHRARRLLPADDLP